MMDAPAFDELIRRVRAGVPRHELFLKPGYLFPFAHRFRFATVTTTWPVGQAREADEKS